MFSRAIGSGIGMSSQAPEAAAHRLRVIEPKLMLPRVHPRTLRRARLLEMLDGDGTSALTVLDAGVGYGKTTLVRSWCAEHPGAVIWMTLDPADDDPVRLWTHLATAVERLGNSLGRRALSSLETRGAPIETAVDELMNGMVAFGRPVAIVIDDLHTVQSEPSVRSLGHALKRMPSNARLLASTRSDPPISLARLRARRALTEIRARELAFTGRRDARAHRPRVDRVVQRGSRVARRAHRGMAGRALPSGAVAARAGQTRRGSAGVRGQRSPRRRVPRR